MLRWKDEIRDKDPAFAQKLEGLEKVIPSLGEKSAELPDKNLSLIDMQTDPKRIEDMVAVRAPFIPADNLIPMDEDLSDREGIVVPSDIVTELIKMSSNRFIMDRCTCRESCKCENYPIELGSIFIGDAATTISPTRGHLASVDEALEHVQKWKDAGLYIHIGHVPFDSDSFGAYPVNNFMSICGCCHCCSVTRFIPSYTKMPGLDLKVDKDKCIGCGKCVEGCGYKGCKLVDGKMEVNEENCKVCGKCANFCPEQAIKVEVTDPEYIKKTLEWITEKTDIRPVEQRATPMKF